MHLRNIPMKTILFTLKFALLTSLVACNDTHYVEGDANSMGHTAPTKVTIQANQKALNERDFSNTEDFHLATKGLIAKEDSIQIKALNGESVWQSQDYAFMHKMNIAPASVNPSLWRQASLNNIHGLFKVTEGIYQLRGYDLANMSIIESDNGWIIVDPLTSTETADHALKFAQKHLGKYPIKAIIFTHSHIDHFGGVDGILQNLSKNDKNTLKIIAPEGFEEEASSENIIAGTAMSRRAMYMYGKQLKRDQRGHIGSGLGKGPAFGTFGLESPTLLVGVGDTTLDVDGLTIHFQSVSGSEAPAEFIFSVPKYNAFCGAELVSRNMHNIYTLRGAKVRDALLWSHYIDQASKTFSDSDVYFASHHWPLWGKEKIRDFLHAQRDTYKFIHDQSVRLINRGYTPNEISEELKLPDKLSQNFHNQGYYGSLSHNAKAVYQAYMGWFTANPSKLSPLSEKEVSTRYIEIMGGVDTVINEAKKQFLAANNEGVADAIKTYRWLAELLNHAVFAEPENQNAKDLLAQIYDQLGYQAESAPWRDFYLTGAYELRHGAPEKGFNPVIMKNILLKMPVEKFFTSMAVRLIPSKANDLNLKIRITFTDLEKNYLLTIKHSVMHHEETDSFQKVDASLSVTHALFVDIMVGQAGLKETLFSDDLSFEGSKIDLIRFFSIFDKPDGTFNIVTP